MNDTTKTYSTHPAAEMFPLMTEQEIKELAEDIREHGLREPIVLYDGKVLDGRNRLIACGKSQTEPRFRELPAQESPVKYVWSVNYTRRHLTASQRAVIAATMAGLLAREAKERMRRGGRISAGKGVETIPPVEKGKARDKAAEIAGVNPHYVSDAMMIARKAPALLKKVEKGEMTIPEARRQLEPKAGEPKTSPTKVADPKHGQSAQEDIPQEAMLAIVDVVMGDADSDRHAEILREIAATVLDTEPPGRPWLTEIRHIYKEGVRTHHPPNLIEPPPEGWTPFPGPTRIKESRVMPVGITPIEAPGFRGKYNEWDKNLWVNLNETLEPEPCEDNDEEEPHTAAPQNANSLGF